VGKSSRGRADGPFMPDSHGLFSELLGLLAPERCAGCDLPGRLAEPPFCAGCALLVERLARPLAAGTMSALYVYAGPVASAVQALKYRGQTQHAPALGARLAELALSASGRVDRVVPLPLHPRRLRERGFNQSRLLARPVARALGVPLDSDLLRRPRDTRPQAGLEHACRLDNVRGAFAVRPGAPPARLLLIDDVRTTGATLAAAAEALLEAGFPPVLSLALAAAPR
jgi:ComF family protein